MKMQTRNEQIDIAKGIAIYLVVLGHLQLVSYNTIFDIVYSGIIRKSDFVNSTRTGQYCNLYLGDV